MKAVLGAMIILLAVAGADAGKVKAPKAPKPPKPPKHAQPPKSSGGTSGVVIHGGGTVANDSGAILGSTSGVIISEVSVPFIILPPSTTDGVILSGAGIVMDRVAGAIISGMMPPLPPGASRL